MALVSEFSAERSSPAQGEGLQGSATFAKWVMGATAAVFLACAAVGLYFARNWQIVHDAPLLHYVVFLMDHGRAPYRDIVEMNMPGAYMAQWLVIHTLGGGSFGWWLADLIAGVAGLLASVWIAGPRRRMAGVAAGALLYTFHLAGGPRDTGQRDWMVAILLLIGFGFLFETLRRVQPAWMVGFVSCCGLAASIKPPALVFGSFTFFVLWKFWRDGKPERIEWPAVLGYSALGGILPAALVIVFLIHWGVTSYFLDALHTLVPWYAGLGHVRWGILVRDSLAIKGFLLGSLVLFVANRSWRRWESAILFGGTLCGWLLVLIQRKGWGYHLYPEAVFLAIWGMLELERALRGKRWTQFVAIATLAVTFTMLGSKLKGLKGSDYPLATIEHLQQDLNDLGGAKLSGRVQCLDVTMGGCINVLYRMRLVQSTGFIYDTYLFPERDTDFTQRTQARFLREITANPPEVIVLTSHSWPRPKDTFAILDRFPALQQVLAEHYRLTNGFPIQASSSGYRIFVLKP